MAKNVLRRHTRTQMIRFEINTRLKLGNGGANGPGITLTLPQTEIFLFSFAILKDKFHIFVVLMRTLTDVLR